LGLDVPLERFEWHSAHHAKLRVNWWLQDALQLPLQMFWHIRFDHGDAVVSCVILSVSICSFE